MFPENMNILEPSPLPVLGDIPWSGPVPRQPETVHWIEEEAEASTQVPPQAFPVEDWIHDERIDATPAVNYQPGPVLEFGGEDSQTSVAPLHTETVEAFTAGSHDMPLSATETYPTQIFETLPEAIPVTTAVEESIGYYLNGATVVPLSILGDQTIPFSAPQMPAAEPEPIQTTSVGGAESSSSTERATFVDLTQDDDSNHGEIHRHSDRIEYPLLSDLEFPYNTQSAPSVPASTQAIPTHPSTLTSPSINQTTPLNSFVPASVETALMPPPATMPSRKRKAESITSDVPSSRASSQISGVSSALSDVC